MKICPRTLIPNCQLFQFILNFGPCRFFFLVRCLSLAASIDVYPKYRLKVRKGKGFSGTATIYFFFQILSAGVSSVSLGITDRKQPARNKKEKKKQPARGHNLELIQTFGKHKCFFFLLLLINILFIDLLLFSQAEERHCEILGYLLYTARLVAKQEGLDDGFRIVINDGPKGCLYSILSVLVSLTSELLGFLVG